MNRSVRLKFRAAKAENKELTHRKLAEYLSVSRVYITNWLGGFCDMNPQRLAQVRKFIERNK